MRHAFFAAPIVNSIRRTAAPVVALVLATCCAGTSAMASNISGGTIIGVFSDIVTSGFIANDPSLGRTTFLNNSGTADSRIVNSTNPATAGTPPLQATGSALIWGDDNGGNGQPSTLDLFGAQIPSVLDQNFRLGRITYSNGTSNLTSLIFGATISFYANAVSTSSFLGSDTIVITTTSNLGQSTSQDSDYINICGNQSNICNSSINAVETSQGGTGVTVDLFGTIVGDPQLFINSVALTAGQTDSGNGFIGTDLPSTVPLPASAPMFGAALLGLGAVGYGMKRKRDAAAA